MSGNIAIIHGGGPTAVINASLYGAIREARRHNGAGRVLGALGGADGVLEERFVDFSTIPEEQLSLLPSSPASAIGTSRRELGAEDYEKMVAVCVKHSISRVLFNGGNGSMDACGKLYRSARDKGVAVVGIPKTIDNDIAVTDHCPGYGSAARYQAQTLAEICQDVRAMPIHVSIMEGLGRNVGWIVGASALAKTDDPAVGPHLVYLPEKLFDEDEFLADVERLHREHGGVVVAVSEGLKNLQGEPVAGFIFQSGRSRYPGDVGSYLAELVIRRLGIKARSEKPALAGRSSISMQSPVDRDEAILAGEEACRTAVEGESGIMIGFERLSSVPYRVKPIRIPIERVMLAERSMPESFFGAGGDGVSPEFIEWCRPLIGGDLRDFLWFDKDGALPRIGPGSKRVYGK